MSAVAGQTGREDCAAGGGGGVAVGSKGRGSTPHLPLPSQLRNSVENSLGGSLPARAVQPDTGGFACLSCLGALAGRCSCKQVLVAHRKDAQVLNELLDDCFPLSHNLLKFLSPLLIVKSF